MCQKPLVTDSELDIIDRNFYYLIQLLCQSKLFVKIAQKNFKYPLKDLRIEERLDFVQCVVEQKKLTYEDLLDLIDMWLSEYERNTIWSIVLLWKNILEENLKGMNTYTTETKISLITELKILRLWVYENIFQSTTLLRKLYLVDENTLAIDVEKYLKDSRAKQKTIISITAQENVSSEAVGKNLLPNLELRTLCRKPLSEKTIAKNVLKH